MSKQRVLQEVARRLAESEEEDEGAFIAVVICMIIAAFLMYKLFKAAVKVVRHSEVMVIERMGRYKTTLKPGLHWIWPIIEQPRRINWRYLDAKRNASHVDVVSVVTERVDMREHVIDFGRQHVITKDTVQIMIDALVYFRVTDPRVAVLNIQNLPDAVELLTQATLRNIIARMTLDDTFSSREQINSALLSKIQRDAERWGVSITRVEIFNIDPPPDIKRAMMNQIKAERDRRSVVLEADGERESAVIRSRGNAAKLVLAAEGHRASTLLRAKGEAQAKTLLATCEAAAVKAIRTAVGEEVRAVDYLAAVEYINKMAAMATGKGDTEVVLVPIESVQAVGAMSGLTEAARRVV